MTIVCGMHGAWEYTWSGFSDKYILALDHFFQYIYMFVCVFVCVGIKYGKYDVTAQFKLIVELHIFHIYHHVA